MLTVLARTTQRALNPMRAQSLCPVSEIIAASNMTMTTAMYTINSQKIIAMRIIVI